MRVARVASLVDELVLDRAAERVGEDVTVIVTGVEDGRVVGRAAHQGADDAATFLPEGFQSGDVVQARVVSVDGPDLVAEPQ